MKLLATFKDDQFEFQGITHNRIAARAVILNDKNEVAILRVYGQDGIEFRDYYETPGGGVKPNEPIDEAVIREAEEEIGYKCEIIAPIGIIEDDYNKIFRHNITHYYLLKTVKKTEKHLEDYETNLINTFIWVSIDEAIEIYKNFKPGKLAKIVQRREIPVFEEAKKIMMEKDLYGKN